MKAGNVMRLKTPNVSSKPRMAEESSESCCWENISTCYPFRRQAAPTLLSSIRCIITRLHNTTNVSTELEKVWVWYVQVT